MTFAVQFRRTITQHYTVVVEAENDLEATDKAESRVDDDDVDWNKATSEIGGPEIEDITNLSK